MSKRPSPPKRPTMTKRLAEAISLAVQTVMSNLTPGWRPQGFIEITPVDTLGKPLGGKIALNAAHIAYMAPAWPPKGSRLKRPIGTRYRMSTDVTIVGREFYQRALWLLWRARRETVVNYSHERDDTEFRTWAYEHLSWQPPAWLEAFDDRNYVHPQDLDIEPEILPDGTVQLSDGSRAIPGQDGILYHKPTVKIDDDGNPVSTFDAYLRELTELRKRHFHHGLTFDPRDNFMPPS